MHDTSAYLGLAGKQFELAAASAAACWTSGESAMSSGIARAAGGIEAASLASIASGFTAFDAGSATRTRGRAARASRARAAPLMMPPARPKLAPVVPWPARLMADVAVTRHEYVCEIESRVWPDSRLTVNHQKRTKRKKVLKKSNVDS